ncbi:MAG: hypothetical protein EA390_02990 [Balneolaceae bacterium]|nr:MAG: hypothetical protein EA390_02990 [Balneolaceae bacterium]
MNLIVCKGLALFLICFLSFVELSAQHSPIKITSEKNSNDSYTFYAENSSPLPYVVTINFTALFNLNSGRPLPYSANVSPGRSRLVNLSPTISGQRTSFRYSYRYHSGCLRTNPENIEYLLPYPEGKKAVGGRLSNISDWIGQDPPEDWYSVVFYVDEEQDTEITAIRKGRVIAVRDAENTTSENLLFTTDRNYVTLLHDDCTFARYSTFRENGIYVKEGDYLYPGDPIGMVAGSEYRFGNQIRVMVYYRNDASISFHRGDVDGVHNWKYVKPLFRTAASESELIEVNQEYISIHPEDVITSEMSRRERRRWARHN